MNLPFHKRWILISLLLAFNATANQANGIRQSLPWFPVLNDIRLRMSVDEFRAVNQSAKPLTASEFKADGNREGHIVFGENVKLKYSEEEVGDRIYYSFLQGKLAQVEWKNDGKNIDPSKARSYSEHMAQIGKQLPSEQKSFILAGGASPIYTATQERFQMQDGTLATLTATEPLFTATVTDQEFLKVIGKEDFFQILSDDHAITEWKKEQGDMEDLSERVIDYLATPTAEADKANKTTPNKTSPETDTQPAVPKTPKSEPTPSTRVEEPLLSTQWPVVSVVIVAALGLLWVLLKKWK